MEDSKIVVQAGEVKVQITGPSEDFGSNDLRLKALLALIEGLDFGYQEEEDIEIRDKYFAAISVALGGKMALEMPHGNNGSELEFLSYYVGWLKDHKLKDPAIQEFIKQHVESEDEGGSFT